nr:integrase, catalytic region, zinc finger, CCHC-type, peptidase aspartic, catalytic [Tanacetum cinerariifolium]
VSNKFTCSEKGLREDPNNSPFGSSKPSLLLYQHARCAYSSNSLKHSINEKRYILVIVDDYSRYTWVHFLRSKDEAPDVIITFLKRITNDREDIGKLGAKGDIGFFVGYSADSCAYRIYHRELDLLFEAMYDDYFGGQPSANVENVPSAQEPQVRQTSTASTTIADNVPIPTNSSSHATNIPITSQDVDELNPNAMVDGNTFINPFANSSTSAAVASSSS